MERSTRFYEEVLDGKLVMDVPMPEDFSQSLFGSSPGTKVWNRFITFADMSIELYQFEPSEPMPAADQSRDGLMHFCLRVDDVIDTVERAERAGGKALFPVRPMFADRHFVYIADPDGHVVELIDATLEECIAGTSAGELPDFEQEAAG